MAIRGDERINQKGTLENLPLGSPTVTGVQVDENVRLDVTFGSYAEEAAVGDFITETLWGSLRQLADED